MWVYGDSVNVFFAHSLKTRKICREIFKECNYSYNWIYPVHNITAARRENDNLDYDNEKVSQTFRQVVERPDMDERSAIILNFGLHFVESVNFSNYRQLIDGLVSVLQGKHNAMRSNVTQRKYRGTVIWKTTTAINKEKASNIHLGHKRFITQQVGAYCDIRGYSHDIDRNDFHSGTSSCHLHFVFLCICLHDTETTVFFPYKSFQNEFIPVFIPNRILVLVRNFILVSCKLKRNFVPNTPNTRNG